MEIKNLETLIIKDYQEYLQYRSQFSAVINDRIQKEKSLPRGRENFLINGFCFICNSNVNFNVDYNHAITFEGEVLPNYREHLSCSKCGFNNRMRAAIHLLETKTEVNTESFIYITEQITPLYRLLKKRHKNIMGSEYLGLAILYGDINQQGVRNESITKLTFPDNNFDAILSFDVLEHVPNYLDGFKECLRILKPEGRLLFSVPFTGLKQIITRAIVKDDGTIEHRLPPEYHGDPLTNEGCLCFHHFGWELLDELRDVGFSDVYALLYWSEEWGYLGKGEQIIFTASKPL